MHEQGAAMRITQLVLEKVACFDRLCIDFKEGNDPKKADIHLIVGANGTGKSTVLMALAQFFTLHRLTGLDRRFVSEDGFAALKTDNCIYAFSPSKNQKSVNIDGISLRSRKSVSPRLIFFTASSDHKDLIEYSDRCYQDASETRFQNQLFSFAAFGYSGFRSTSEFTLSAIQEQNENPLANALLFSNPSASQELIQWIANTKAKEAFARNRGDIEKAEQRKEAVVRIERIISDIIEQRFAFVLNEDPLGVLVEVDGQALDMELLPDGLKSILSWVADLLMRLDRIPWENDVPVLERPFLLFLDEIEVHLHPAWQRKILPAVQELFPNAQVFVSTHSPFVIASADDAWIYPLVRKGPFSTMREPIPSMKGNSYATILREALGIDASFSTQVESLFGQFYQLRDEALHGDKAALSKMNTLQEELAAYGEEVNAVVVPEIRQTLKRLEAKQDKAQ
jgi:predicted ATP-binding protein involved in virulence